MSGSLRRQVYYDLREERKEQGKEKEVAIVRVEQLAPFPFDLINRELKRYPNADVMWCVFCLLQAHDFESTVSGAEVWLQLYSMYS